MYTQPLAARNVHQYSDLISDSAPTAQANHTFDFLINTNVAPSGQLEFTFPSGFTLLSTTTFGVRNVELWVNGAPRTASSSAGPGVDQIDIVTGDPGSILYTLAPDSGLTSGDALQLKVGNHTSGSIGPYTSFSTTTGTTTYAGDIEPIQNSSTLGIHRVQLAVWDGGIVADAGFVIFLNQPVTIPPADTTETVPPFRFNGAPTSTVGGTTPNVEISLETDELAICRYSTTAGVAYSAMTDTFSNTGLVFHSTVVAVLPETTYSFYVRCIDDENNINSDDYLIEFTVEAVPDGEPGGGDTGDGDSSGGDGDGSGGDGSGGGSGGGSGSGSGSSGGGGGGGGGGTGNDDGDTAGGGFESDDAPYRSGDARVVISGYSFPNSTVTVLVDGNIVETVRAGGNGSYSATVDAIARGVYTFGVYGEASDKVKSPTFSTSFTVTGGRTSELTNINVSPSIKVSPDPVNPGETLTVTGYALPNSTVTVQNGKAKTKIVSESTAEADSSGKWSLTLNTTNFSKGTYQIRAKSVQSGGVTANYAGYIFYGVGEKAETGTLSADLNRDGKVNLIDFSILLFWWNTNGGDSNPPADINRDGRVTLTDFSILLFNWTG